MPRYRILLAALAAVACAYAAKETRLFSVLKSTVSIGKQPEGFYLLPTNQLLKPWGEQTVIPGRPVDMAFDAPKRRLAVLNSRSVSVLDATSGAHLADVPTRPTSYAGIAFHPSGREVWASETARNGPDSIAVIPLTDQGTPGPIQRVDFMGHPVPSGLAFAPDGQQLFVALSRRNSLGIVQTSARHLVREVPVGVAPFGVAYVAKYKRIFVTNRGGRPATDRDAVAPSSGTAVVTDPVTGSSRTGTVTVVDAESMTTQDVPVGLAPSSMAVSPDEETIVVANGHSDSITVLNTKSLARAEVKIPAVPANTLGSQPIAAAFAADGKTLYVACAGNNAIAVLTGSGTRWRLNGTVPTGWFPSAVSIDSNGSLRILTIKGLGNTANHKGAYNSREFEGSLLQLPPPANAQLAAGTREVEAANSPQYAADGSLRNLQSLGIEHVLLIVKENRTYDQVFGDLPQGNGDPKLTMYGRDITPNHHALAEKYVLLDNFYTGGAISFDGHHWLMQGFVSDYVERAFAASPRGYAWNMADALTVAPTGFFWQGGQRPLDVRVYGEFCLPAKWDPATRSVIDMHEDDVLSWSEYWQLYLSGKWRTQVGSRTGVPALEKIIRPRYPANTTNIPDQLRATEFLDELAEAEQAGHWPHITVLTLNEDHTNGTRPGSPTPRAMVADNDLALGRIIEGFSKSRFWSKSLILVVEDDAQNGLDHVDGHRTIALAIGPFVRRKAVDSSNYNHMSMVRTIQDIFQIPPRTRFVQAARAMNSIFTKETDLSPYQTLTPKVALDEMNPPVQGLQGRRKWAAQQSARMNWADLDDVPETTLNRILWWDAKGYDQPYPERR